MKILRIWLANLNSLKGAHMVDLSAEPLASAGLFAIIGPTGAGKSTLLDAITLALFGKAARYGNESNPEHVMSRHCGWCSAEVEFEVPAGRFRAMWERRRARNKPDGALQQPKRYIYDAAGHPLAQQIREADTMIEDLLGLNYDRFLRSALLAQGEFAKFLKASANERAELLQKLTGTEIYSRLGRLAHTEANRREADLEEKERAKALIKVMGDEALKELEVTFAKGQERRKHLDKEVADGQCMSEKINALQKARKNQRIAADDLGKIADDRKKANADLERLRLHRLTVPLAGKLARLDAAETALESAKTDLRKAEIEHTRDKSNLAIAIANLRASTQAALSALSRKISDAEESIKVSNEAAGKAQAWLEQNRKDAALENQIGDLAALIGDLKNARSAFDESWSKWKDAAISILPEAADSLLDDENTGQESVLVSKIDAFLIRARGQRTEMEQIVERAGKEFQLRKDHLEKARWVAKFKDRTLLKEGEPCPLCGGLEHPYAVGGAPDAEIADLEEELKKAENNYQEAGNAYKEFNRTIKLLETNCHNLHGAQRKRSELSVELGSKLQCLTMELPAAGKEDALRIELQNRQQDYRKQSEKFKSAEHAISDENRKAKAAADEAHKLKNKLSKLPVLHEVNAAEGVVIQSVSDAEEQYTNAVIRENATRNRAADRRDDVTKAVKVLAETKAALEAAAASSEFKTLEKLKQARLPADEADKIEAHDKSLGVRQTKADVLMKQSCQEIDELLEQKVFEGDDADSFRMLQKERNNERDELLQAQITRHNQLEQDGKNRKQLKELGEELEQDLKALGIWRTLRELIGSHDGSKFSRYAQTISLDILTRLANLHLDKLSDRYRICRDEQEALNLQIEDLHQAGAKRPMTSLSGGESFLVSLALALGLSDLSGRTVRIDSLFIDEGFGSLDQEALEVAITALESLRQRHKTVGIISHVGLLKERINTRLVVEKQADGVSKVYPVRDGF